jgi:hypothetical protein
MKRVQTTNCRLGSWYISFAFFFLYLISNYLLLVLGISDEGSRKGREEQRMTSEDSEDNNNTTVVLPYRPTISAYHRRLVLHCLDLDSSTHIRPQMLLRQPQPISSSTTTDGLLPMPVTLPFEWRSKLEIHIEWLETVLFQMCRTEFKRVVVWVS